MIGDGATDIGAGKNAGCKTALIGEKNWGQDITANSLLEAVEIILANRVPLCCSEIEEMK